MTFLEIALQGVKGFPPSVKVALRPGYNVLLGAEQAPMGRLLELLLYADDGQPSVELIAAAGQPSRAGLTLQGKDGATYRLVGDFATGGRALLKFDPAAQRFSALSERAAEVSQYLRGALGMPGRKLFAEIFTTVANALPSRSSRGPGAQKVVGAAPRAPHDKPGFAARQAMEAQDLPTDPAVLKSTLEKLRAELETARNFVAAGDRVAELQQEIADLEKELAPLRKLEEEERELVLEMQKFAAAEALPAGVEDRIKRIDQLVKRRDEAMARIGREKEHLDGLLERPLSSFWGDVRFWAAALGGLALLGAAPFLGAWRWLAVLDLVPFGFAGFFAWQWVSGAEERDGLVRKLESLGERAKVVEREFENAMALVKQAQDALGVQDPNLILHLIEQMRDKRAALESKRKEIARARDSSPLKEKLARQAQAREELKAADAAVLAQGYTRDPSEVERDIARYESALTQMLGAGAGGGVGDVASLFEAKFAAGEDDRARDLLLLACDLFVTRPDEIGKAIAARFAQYLAALSGRKFVTGSIDAAGVLIVTDPQGRSVPFTALSAAERDEVWLALKLTLLERYLGRHKVPLVLDDCFAGFDEVRRGLAAKMLKYLGSLAQVVQCADAHAFASSADQAVRVQ